MLNGYWDYRVVYFPDEKMYSACEVYFNKYGDPEAYCTASSSGDSIAELRRDVAYKENATYKPIIIAEDDNLKEMK